MAERQVIRDFYNKILGYIEDKGNYLVARNFYNKILGYYYKNRNVTTDFYNRVLANGNILASLIMNDANK
ncbi:MAG: hypothetical protein ACOX4W_03210 [Bacilli bacterium]